MINHHLVVLGGCHVVGYPIGPAQAFPALLNEALGGGAVTTVPHVDILRLPTHLAAFDAVQPSHVVFQLGNYESTACLHTLWQQVRRAFAFPLPGKARTAPGPVGCGLARGVASASGPGKAAPTVLPQRAENRLVQGARLAAAAGLLGVVWLSARYRHSFRVLDACVRSRPDTAFVFLSPFPNLSPTDNAMRRLGSWLLRRRLPRAPNVHWLNAHALLNDRSALFADLSHLNAHGHASLADGLAAVCGVASPVELAVP